MPMYPYKCTVCDCAFTLMRRMSQQHEPVECPECQKSATFDISGLGGVGIIDYMGVPATVHQQAERNARKYGKELSAMKLAAVEQGFSPNTVTGKKPE